MQNNQTITKHEAEPAQTELALRYNSIGRQNWLLVFVIQSGDLRKGDSKDLYPVHGTYKYSYLVFTATIFYC